MEIKNKQALIVHLEEIEERYVFHKRTNFSLFIAEEEHVG